MNLRRRTRIYFSFEEMRITECLDKSLVMSLVHVLLPVPHPTLDPDVLVPLLVAAVLPLPLTKLRPGPSPHPRPALYHGSVDRLVLSQLLLKPIVGLDTEPPLLDMVERGLEVGAVGLHDVCDDQGPGPRHSVVAVDQHLAPRPKTRVYELLDLLHFRNNRLETTVSQSYHKILQLPLEIGPEKIRNKYMKRRFNFNK